MNTTKESKVAKKPSLLQSLLILVCVIGVVAAALRFGVSIQISLTLGVCVSIIASWLLGNKYEDIQNNISKVIGDSAVTLLILLAVGMMVGVWIIGGTVPSLLYYGLVLCSPTIIVPITFVMCSLTSVFTGTSYGSVATMGLALFGVGVGMGISPYLMAGAVVSGSYFGDKLSPLSDTTNTAAVMSGTDLYAHVGSQMRTTVPATIICIILYAILGAREAAANADLSNIQIMEETLLDNFNISIVALIPAVLVLVVSILKFPSVPALLGCTLVSVIFAMILQGASLPDILNAAMNGYTSDTGVAMVDNILNRGGIASMLSTIAVIILSGTMGAALESSGIISVIVEEGLFRFVKKPRGLIISTMVYVYTLLLVSGHQMMPIILGGRTFRPAYDKMGVQSRVLSRTLEDCATIGAPVVPWSASALYVMSVLGVGIGYIPYAFLSFIVPVFAIIYACTGLFVWRTADAKTAAGTEA